MEFTFVQQLTPTTSGNTITACRLAPNQNLEIRLKDSTRLFSPLALALGVVFGCAVVAAPLAQAAADPKRDAELETRFKAADKNNDGCLTRQEAEAGMPRVAKGFDKIDAAKKGCITLDQIKAFADK
jgi:hypothetical protein